MPFKIETIKNKTEIYYLLKNIHTNKLVKKKFKSRETAIKFAKNAIRFREKKDSKLEGNKILPIY